MWYEKVLVNRYVTEEVTFVIKRGVSNLASARMGLPPSAKNAGGWVTQFRAYNDDNATTDDDNDDDDDEDVEYICTPVSIFHRLE